MGFGGDYALGSFASSTNVDTFPDGSDDNHLASVTTAGNGRFPAGSSVYVSHALITAAPAAVNSFSLTDGAGTNYTGFASIATPGSGVAQFPVPVWIGREFKNGIGVQAGASTVSVTVFYRRA